MRVLVCFLLLTASVDTKRHRKNNEEAHKKLALGLIGQYLKIYKSFLKMLEFGSLQGMTRNGANGNGSGILPSKGELDLEPLGHLIHSRFVAFTPWDSDVGVVNLAGANVRVRCQSMLVDHRDLFLGPQDQFRFKFVDFDRGNQHFWCDAHGLFEFDETFDVFGRTAPSRSNLTWFIKQDGLYVDTENNRIQEWFWNYAPFSSYAE